MLDDRVLAALAALEAEDAADGAAGVLATTERSLPVGPESGRVLFALAAAIPRCRVLELGASRGYSTLWLAAGARVQGGSVVSLEANPRKVERWRKVVAEAGLEAVARVVDGDAYASVALLDGPFDLVLIDVWKDDYEPLFQRIRPLVPPGGIVVADNVVDHAGVLADYLTARRDDPTVSTVTLPVDNGLELTTVLTTPITPI